MSLPTLQVQLDLGDPSTTATWATDISTYVRGWSTTRGTSTELQRTEAGTGTILLDNRDGRFSPMNTLSPYSPNILPMRRARIRATWSSITYPVFTGYIESWPSQFPFVGADQVVPIQIVDGFKILALSKVSASISSSLSGAYIGAILDAIGWPAADRDLDTGQSTMPATTLENIPALEQLMKVERAEGGRIFIARDGKLTFVDRQAFTLPVGSYTGRTWSDTNAAAMTYRDLTPRFDDTLIINEARLTRTGGVEQVAQNAASATKYGTAATNFRTLSESDVLLSTDNQVSDLATWTVNTFGEPAQRIEAIQDNAMGHDRWDYLLARELGDAVLVEKTPMGSTQISQRSFLEGISHAWAIDEWRSSVNVSPAGNITPWIWDDSVYGVWDSTTIWGR
jgi:hypothetical protein